MTVHRRLPAILGLVLAGLLLLAPGRIQAQEAWRHVLAPRLMPLTLGGSAELGLRPARQVLHQDSEMSFTALEADLLVPLIQRPGWQAGLTLSASHTWVDTQARLPDSGMRFPSELWDLRLGGLYRRQLDNGWIFSALAMAGSSSDKPFNSYDEISLTALASLRVPVDRARAWHFMLAYSNTSDFLAGLPIPGLAWSYQPSRRTSLILGAPMSMLVHAPSPKSRILLFYMFPHTIRARASVFPAKGLEVFVAFRWVYEDYALANRSDSDDQLFIYEKKAVVGLSYQLTPKVRLAASAAWVMDRLIFQGEDFRDTNSDRMELSPGPEFTVTLRFSL